MLDAPEACVGKTLTVAKCSACSLVQLAGAPVSYYQDVIRATGISKAMAEFRLAQFSDLKQRYLAARPEASALEVGAGLGDYAALLAQVFAHVSCTERSSRAAREANACGLTVFETHPDLPSFPTDLAGRTFDLICCFSYLEHLPRPVEALRAIRQAAHADTVFLIEVPNSHFIFQNGLLNELIPDHLSYFTGNTLVKTLDAAGLEVVSLTEIWDGYILSAICRPVIPDVVPTMVSRYEAFRETVDALLAAHGPDATIAVWGAGHQALFTIATTGLRDRTRYIVDSAPFKQDKRAPGSGVPVYAPAHLHVERPDVVIVACAGYNREVHRTLESMDLGGAAIYLLSGLTLERAS